MQKITKKRRNNNNRNNKHLIKTKKTKKTKDKNSASVRLLKKGFSLYASKKFEGDKLLEYKRKAELESKDSCLMDNSSWFGDLDVARSYARENTNIYKWKINKPTKLLRINKENVLFLDNLFKNTKIILTPCIQLTKKQLTNIKYTHEYLNMSNNEKALYEFKFAFGYIDIKEQFEFMKLVKYLIENNYIKIDNRSGDSIVTKLNYKINYYRVSHLISSKKMNNRLSIYLFDKYAIMNFCKLLRENKINISGVYQKNDTSFWFPDFIVYKMNIQEYILFNPHKNLTYEKMVE